MKETDYLKKRNNLLDKLTELYIFVIIVIFPFCVDSTGFFKILECKYRCYLIIGITYIAPTQTATCGCTTSSSTVLITEDGENYMRIRKLTPLECFRLMGFDDSDFYKIKSVGISDTQLYKMAGNSIVVNVLEFIFKELFYDNILEKCA